MNVIVHEFVNFIENNKSINTKEELISIVNNRFNLIKDGRAIYHTDFFAVVFCYSKNNSFNNVVLSLSKLEKYDRIPCFVVLVKKNLDNCIFLINSTFIEKISHSSQKLSVTNIKGSFLGCNIRKDISEIKKQNTPPFFDDLFAYHQGLNWKDNIERIVECTNNIKPCSPKFAPTKIELNNILESPCRAIKFIQSKNYTNLLNDLRYRCNEVNEAILITSHIENVNIRGRLIEFLITSDSDKRKKILQNIHNIEHLLPTYDTTNELGDYIKSFDDTETHTDIKTKVLYLDSNPKAYNIDKFLKCMSKENSIFMFFFVGINENGIVNTTLCSVFHDSLMKSTLLQHHWAGRGTRGVAQFNGTTINNILNEIDFNNNINELDSKDFLLELLNR